MRKKSWFWLDCEIKNEKVLMKQKEKEFVDVTVMYTKY